MSTRLVRALSCLVFIPAMLIGYAAHAAPRGQAPVVSDYDVFVDPPTAYAFIKLPDGWKLIGKLDADQPAHLPSGTLTSLLPPDDDALTRLPAEATRTAVTTKRKSKG